MSLSAAKASQKLNINRSTLLRWREKGILITNDGQYSEAGIDAIVAAVANNGAEKEDFQQIYDRTEQNMAVSSMVPDSLLDVSESSDERRENIKANIELLRKYHAKIGNDPKTGQVVVKPLLVTWVAYLQAKFEGRLVADQDTGQLWLEEVTADTYNLNELPPISSLLYDASLNWGVDDSSTSNKKIEDAMAKVAELVPQINPYAERLALLKDNWDGKKRLDTIFQDLLASPQEPKILKEIARTWFNGAIHNWTRATNDLVFPMMLDINATAQGTGKSFFFNVINGIMTGADGKADSAVDGDLNDPANIYPQLIGKAVVNDDEHRVYNASHPIGRQASGSDVNAAYKNWITLDTLEWMPKHSNQVRKVPVRYVLGRTSNIAKPYNDNDTTEVDRRFLTVRGGEFHQIKQKSVQEYTQYMKQVLGEAMANFKWDSAKDANMSPTLREAMKIEQILGSKQGDGWEFINEIMAKKVSLNFFAGQILEIQAYLSGSAPHLANAWRETAQAEECRFVRPRAISGALFKMSQAIGTKTTKDQAEALTMKWLSLHGYVDHPKHDFKWKGAHYQGDFMVNMKLNQYEQDQSVDELTPILDKLQLINPLTLSKKDVIKNLKEVMEQVATLSEGTITDNPSDMQTINESINKALQLL